MQIESCKDFYVNLKQASEVRFSIHLSTAEIHLDVDEDYRCKLDRCYFPDAETTLIFGSQSNE